MKLRFVLLLAVVLSSVSLSACGSDDVPSDAEFIDKQLNEIMAAKTPFATGKGDVPLLNTHDWDTVFGGPAGDTLKYDRYGEIDELVFVALPNTPFQLQRQIRKKTRSGTETIYYKVTTPVYQGDQELWVDGRFLDLQDVRTAPISDEAPSAAKTLITLRNYEGSPYTWRGSSETGVPELLEYYPPAESVSARTQDDWMLKGFDSLGMLYRASGGQTPLDLKSLSRLGEGVFVDTSEITNTDADGNTIDATVPKAKKIMTGLRPLDVISMGDRVWIVLDQSQVIESKYRSKFDGSIQITSLFDTLVGLLQKGVYVKDPFAELEDKNAKKFFIRRYADTDSLFMDQLTGSDTDESADEEATAAEPEEITTLAPPEEADEE
ncbi:MAG: hypothetical protein AB7J40_03660 [Candidatus Altimarinota bacterium]